MIVTLINWNVILLADVCLIFPWINFLSKLIDADFIKICFSYIYCLNKELTFFFSRFIETWYGNNKDKIFWNIFLPYIFHLISFIYQNFNDNNISNALACLLGILIFPSNDQHRSNKTYQILPYLPYCIIIHIIFPLTKRLLRRSGRSNLSVPAVYLFHNDIRERPR